MRDANMCGTSVWIHRLLATVSRHMGTGIAAAGDYAFSRHVHTDALEGFRAFDRDAGQPEVSSDAGRVTREASLI